MKILSPSRMRHLEGEAEQQGLPSSILMERAAQAVFQLIRKDYPSLSGPVLIVCGRGNNGGDGLALATLLNPHGQVCLALGEPEEGSLGAFHLARCREMGITVEGPEWFLAQKSEDYSLIVDALLGTGLNRPVSGTTGRIIDKINRSGKPVVSVDIPSGVNGLNGRIEGTAVRADKTVTFGLPKGGNLLYPGFGRGGDLNLSSLDISPELREKETSLFRINEPEALPAREPSGHKSTWGSLLFVGGSSRYGGAPLFASSAFLKSGGGFVNLVIPESLSLPMMIGLPEAVQHPMPALRGPFLGMGHLEEIQEMASGKRILLLGPGMGLEEETGELVRELVRTSSIPVIVDGDGLTHLAGHEELARQQRLYMTPHPGEAARLLKTGPADIESDRPGAVRELAERYGATVVLKGAHSLIAAPGEDIRMNLTGDTSLATAGSGDILGGILGAMLGMGLMGGDALGTAVFLHGLAGEEAGTRLGQDSVLASDILDALPSAVRNYRSDFSRYRSGLNGRIGIIP